MYQKAKVFMSSGVVEAKKMVANFRKKYNKKKFNFNKFGSTKLYGLNNKSIGTVVMTC